MSGTDFLHGVEIIEIDDGPRLVRSVKSSVIGLVGTAPDADPIAFPLNTPVLVAGSRMKASQLDTKGKSRGTLPTAIEQIFDQVGAFVVVVRVEEGKNEHDFSKIIGGYNQEGQDTGIFAFLSSQPNLGVTPRILIAPGFTHQSLVGVDKIELTNAGKNYTKAQVSLSDGGGVSARAHAIIKDGKITAIQVLAAGQGYVSTPTVIIEGDGTGATAKATIGNVANPVVTALIPIAERLRAIIVADGPSTTDEDAIAYAKHFDHKRVYMVDPFVKRAINSFKETSIVNLPASSSVAGVIAKVDSEKGFWWSPSNQLINGIVGMSRPIDFSLDIPYSRSNLLNAQGIATIINENGYRLWGNRTLASDSKWQFLSVVRTSDIINDSILRSHLWAVDRNITSAYFDEVTESVNAYLRQLKALGAILGGHCYATPELNSEQSIKEGKAWFNIDFTPPYPAEHIIFHSRIVDDYLEEVL
ncbi:phage tail sheath subtilisin-like domain-containing protein [Bartonella sp. B17]